MRSKQQYKHLYRSGHLGSDRAVSTNASYIYPKYFTQLFGYIKYEYSRCAFPECNKIIPTGGRKKKYCDNNNSCKEKHKRRIRAEKAGIPLVWRGTRRPGL